MITPREMLRDYMTVLNILMQNEKVTFEQIISRDGVISEAETVEEDVKEEAPSKVYSAQDIEF